jgi:hypothetical protein
MGLDSVEILMKVEKTFGIIIPDREAEKIITVGDFHDSVWRHLEGKYSEKCKSQNIFYKLRQSFTDVFNFPKPNFTLDSSLNEIFPQENRRQVYSKFADANNLQLPDLTLTKGWAACLNIVAILLIIGGLGLSIILINFLGYSKWTLLFPLIGIVLTYLISEILNPKRTVIRPLLVQDFTKEVLAINYTNLAKENGTNRKEVEYVVNHIIADMAGLELEEVIPEKRIGDDLGID